MSEPRRFGLWKRFKEDSFMVCHGDYDMTQLGPCDTTLKVVEAEPILARIKQLEAQLKEANAVAEFYGDEKNWMTTHKDELHEARMTIAQDAESFGVCHSPGLVSTLLLIGGKRAREYVRKWKEEK